MSHRYFFITLILSLCVAIPVAHAIKFNPETLRAMQEEGLKIADQIHAERAYRLVTGKCLHVDGDLSNFPANIVIADCNNSPNQIWRFDEQGRFVNQSGACATVHGDGNIVAAACGEGADFNWQPGANGLITHQASGQCIAVHGDPNAAASNVALAGCAENPNQVWMP